MCVAAVAWHAHPRWQLVAIGNRDELHERDSAPLARWAESDILAGRDLVGGGTWLGVSETGRFALITNRRGFGDPDPAKRSRGELATALLRGDAVPAPLQSYNAFNVLAAGKRIAGNTPLIIVNQPMFISDGKNSDVRYNFFYPRWVYDQYREFMPKMAAEQGWRYVDLWNLVPPTEFTNSAVHLTPAGSKLLAQKLAESLP